MVVTGAVVFVISAVLIYLISAFIMKEKTFEEVMVEQKRQQEAEKKRAKLEKKHEKEGRKKFKKKEKSPQSSLKPESSGSGSGSDHEGKDHKMVEYELEPDIIEPLEVKLVKAAKKKKPAKSILHKKLAKSILHNKEKKMPVAPDPLVQQIIHPVPTPKDDLELKHAHERDQEIKREKLTKHESEPKGQPVVVEEMVVKKENHVHSATPPTVESKTSYKQPG